MFVSYMCKKIVLNSLYVLDIYIVHLQIPIQLDAPIYNVGTSSWHYCLHT